MNFTEKTKFVLERGENIVGNSEKAGYQESAECIILTPIIFTFGCHMAFDIRLSLSCSSYKCE